MNEEANIQITSAELSDEDNSPTTNDKAMFCSSYLNLLSAVLDYLIID